MKRFLGIVVVLVLLVAVSNGCYYDKEDVLYPSTGCDTAAVKYSNQVTYIITNKCYECHSNATEAVTGSGVSFEGYTNVSNYFNLGTGAGAAFFMKSIKHEAGVTPMPKGLPKLSDCEIRTIEIWIQNGYPNN